PDRCGPTAVVGPDLRSGDQARPKRELEPLDDGDVGLAAALAHGLQAVAAAGAFELVEQRGHEAGTGGAERVAERDGPAVDVDLLVRDADLLHPREHDRRERLVA